MVICLNLVLSQAYILYKNVDRYLLILKTEISPKFIRFISKFMLIL
jgi:hypothetical protein